MNAVYYLIYSALAALTADTLKRMIYLKIIRKLVNGICLCKGKVRELFSASSHNVYLRIRQKSREQKRGYVSQISSAPNAYLLFSAVRYFHKLLYGMHRNAYKLAYRRYLRLNVCERIYPVAIHFHIFLHESVKSARTELGRAQIVFFYKFVFRHGCIRDEQDFVSLLKLSLAVVDDFAPRLMYKRHRKLFAQYALISPARKIPLIRSADRQIFRTDYYLVIQRDLLEADVKLSGSCESIDLIYHFISPLTIAFATLRS